MYKFVQSPREFVMTGDERERQAKRWILTVLEVPGIPLPPGLNGETGPIGHCPLSVVVRYTYCTLQDYVGIRVFVPSSSWLITQSSRWQTQVHVGTSRIWDEQEAFQLFEAVCAMAGEYGLTKDPEIASAITSWFLNRMALIANSVNGLAIADVEGNPVGLQTIAIDTQTGKCYAQMADGMFVTPEGETRSEWDRSGDVVTITLPA